MHEIVILDIRDYNVEAHHQQSDIRIPHAYLKRFINEIPNQKLHVIANDRLELNLGLRFLLSKGYRVSSYQISNCPCKDIR
nr:sulfurtransferase [Paenibacillus bovis]